MRTVTAKELKELDPKRFDREYWEWRENSPLWDDWYEYVEQNFTDDMAARGVRVDDIQFSLSYSQGDYASFIGRVDVSHWMQCNKWHDVPYSEEFPALFLAVDQDGSYMLVETSNRGHQRYDFRDCTYNTEPCGLFQHLEQEAWETLIEEQSDSADLESNLEAWCNARSHELYCKLRDEYEHYTSEESFIDSCECNDVTFELETEDEIHS